MDEALHRVAQNLAQTMLDWLDIYARLHSVSRDDLMELFIDTLRALEQARAQED